jgi:hypothetical protein
MISKTLTTALIATALAFGATISPSIAGDLNVKEHRTDIRVDWDPRHNKVTVTSFTGCRSAHGSARLTSNFQVSLDRDTRQIDIKGGFLSHQENENVDSERIRIGPADCMGSQHRSVELLISERGSYVINRRSQPVREAVLGQDSFNFVIHDKQFGSAVETIRAKQAPAMFLTAE